MKKLIPYVIAIFFLISQNGQAQIEAGVTFDYSHLHFSSPNHKATGSGSSFFLQGNMGKNIFLRSTYSLVKYQVNGKDSTSSDFLISPALGYYFKSKKISKFSFPIFISANVLQKARIGFWGFKYGVRYQHNYRWSFFSELNHNFSFSSEQQFSNKGNAIHSISLGAMFNLFPLKRLKKEK